jgi:hypothetical protein
MDETYMLHTAWYANLEALVQNVRFLFFDTYYQYF